MPNNIETKDILFERLAITLYLLFCFTFLHLIYTQTKGNIDSLLNLGDITSEQGFKFNYFVDILNLMLGVIIGNVGWDHRKDVGLYGTWGWLKLSRYSLLMVSVTVLMGAIANCLYYFFVLEGTFNSDTIEYILSPITKYYLWVIAAILWWCLSTIVLEKNTPISVRIRGR
ncbi:hypothetical protein [Photobacterium swingsii]|uniref:hypothetical protein n=1 Tax=Photobacterium swingsii TaxID=680026 RepID=UPI004068F39E